MGKMQLQRAPCCIVRRLQTATRGNLDISVMLLIASMRWSFDCLNTSKSSLSVPIVVLVCAEVRRRPAACEGADQLEGQSGGGKAKGKRGAPDVEPAAKQETSGKARDIGKQDPTRLNEEVPTTDRQKRQKRDHRANYLQRFFAKPGEKAIPPCFKETSRLVSRS